MTEKYIWPTKSYFDEDMMKINIFKSQMYIKHKNVYLNMHIVYLKSTYKYNYKYTKYLKVYFYKQKYTLQVLK